MKAMAGSWGNQTKEQAEGKDKEADDELGEIRAQLEAMQEQLSRMGKKK